MKRLCYLTFLAVTLVGCNTSRQSSEQPPADEARKEPPLADATRAEQPPANGAGAEPSPANGAGEAQEPPQLFFLELEGKRIPIELDKPLGTDVLGGAKAVTLRVEPHRVFRYAGLRFHYPREYTFEADLDMAAVWLWTLSGNDSKIIIQQYKSSKDHGAALELVKKELVAVYKDNKTIEAPVKLSIRGTEVKGKRIEVSIANTLIRQDLYSFPSGKDSIVVILQDSPQDSGSPSADRTRMEKMFCETLQLPGK